MKNFQEKVEQLLPLEKSGYVCFSDYHTGFTGRFNIYDLVLEKPFFKGKIGYYEEISINDAIDKITNDLFTSLYFTPLHYFISSFYVSYCHFCIPAIIY